MLEINKSLIYKQGGPSQWQVIPQSNERKWKADVAIINKKKFPDIHH